MSEPRYTLIIQWSEEDHCYVVSLPEWGAHTHGDTYEEAAKNAREVLDMLIENNISKPGKTPTPKLFQYPGADIVNLPLKKQRRDAARQSA